MSPGSEGAGIAEPPARKNPLRESQGVPRSSSTTPWRGRDGTDCVAREELLQRLSSLRSSASARGRRVPSCSTCSRRWVRNSATTAPNAAQAQSRPISLCKELGLWTLAATEELPFPKGKGPKFTLRGCSGTDTNTARPCQGRTPHC